MNAELKNKLQEDFEKYMCHSLSATGNFSLLDFVSFASTVINFTFPQDTSSKVEKVEAGRYLINLYNGGLKNKIDHADIHNLVEIIVSDPNVDFSIVNLLYGI